MLTQFFAVGLDGLITVVSTLVLQTLIPVAFLVLWERRVLASVQRRQGPNAIGLFGLLQPVADGVKLMLKEGIMPRFASRALYLVAPLLSLIIAFTC
jgi:NADH-quinone oxidoreductase subunit H